MYKSHIFVYNYIWFAHIFAISIKQKKLYSNFELIAQKKHIK